jgi:protein-tyrosine-phosphatase
MAATPSALLFACTNNSVRSPMAEALMKHLHGTRIYVDSAGVRALPLDPFAAEVLQEIGIDRSRHRAKRFEDLEDDYFDLIVTLSPEAHHNALEMTRSMACDVEFWPTFDPTAVEGSRAVMLDAYRSVRDGLLKRIRTRFGPGRAGAG